MQEKIYSVFLSYIIFLLITNIAGCNGGHLEENAVPGYKYEKDAITLQEAIEKGKEALKNAGFEHWNENLAVSADDNNTAWKEYYSDPSILGNKYIKSLNLKERKYWAIDYSRPPIPGEELGLGGSGGFVFIDRSNGKVIGCFLEP